MQELYPAALLDAAPSGFVPSVETIAYDPTEAVEATRRLITEQGQFNSEKDRAIALDLVGDLEINVRRSDIAPSTFQAALDSLAALVPTANLDGNARQIAGRTIRPTAEQRIASRLAAPEVDIAGAEGSWGKLPDVVKERMTSYGADLKIEMTSNCTVGCSFCGLAEKGPIESKVSFDSILEIVEYYLNRQSDTITFDWLYWGTDPFDIKWAATDQRRERDYTDLAEAYWAKVGNYRILGTSTAVPLGEELRIINFANKFCSTGSPKPGSLRLSITKANEDRVRHIQTVIKALQPYGAPRISTNDVRGEPAFRGANWDTEKPLRAWDVIGPDCRDGVIIGVNSVDSVMLQGSSPERRRGALRQPMESIEDDAHAYRVPRHYEATLPRTIGKLDQAYPYATVDTIRVRPGQDPEVTTETLTQDPHRALLRLATAHMLYRNQLGRGLAPELCQPEFEEHFGQSLRVVQEHLASNPENWAMREMIKMLGYLGVIRANRR